MHFTDHDPRQKCRVIPFVRPKVNEVNVVTSSIAAVIAVTIIHNEGESPEEHLLNIIDASREAEILDIANLTEDFDILGDNLITPNQPANDNSLW
jgi:hypothetical protein